MALSADSTSAQPTASTISLPVVFVENAGQWQPEVLYGGLLSPIQFLRDRVLWARRPQSLIHRRPSLETASGGEYTPAGIQFLHPSSRMTLRPLEGADGPARLYIGPDSTTWRPAAKILRGMEYHDVWDSVDVIYRGTDDGGMIQTVRLRPGATPSQVAIVSEHTTSMFGASTQLLTKNGTTVQTLSRTLGFIPDTTEFSTYIGGAAYEDIVSVRVHTDGSIYVAGRTWSSDHPFTGPRYSPEPYVLRLGCDGRTVLFCSVYAALTSPGPDSNPRRTRDCVMNLRQDGHVFIACIIESIDQKNFAYPLTPNALEAEPDSNCVYCFLLEWDDSGVLRYASLFGTGDLNTINWGYVTIISSIAFDSNAMVLLTGRYSYENGSFRYPDSVRSSRSNLHRNQ